MFYTQDFITGTMFMSDEQVGIYVRLLCAQHQHGGLIQKIVFNNKVGTHDIIREKFVETEDGFFNERMMVEIEKRKKKSSNMSAKAKLRWDKHKQEQCVGITSAKPTEDEDENEIVNEIEISNDISKAKKKAKKFIAPTVGQVVEYFVSKGYSEQAAVKAFEYYNEANWHDSEGKPVKNWKQKMISIWFKEENKAGANKTKGKDEFSYI